MIDAIRNFLESRRAVARDPRAHDIYVVEFPKSGITWLCTLLANMALHHAGSTQRVTYYNVQQYIPDIHMTGRTPIGDSILPAIPQRLIKSHARCNRHYQGVIYLARHPADVMKSYCTYLNQQAGRATSLESLLTDQRHGLPAWQAHVRGWLGRNDRGNRLHLVRYEDLLEHAADVLLELAGNLGWSFTAADCAAAVERSSVDNMKDSEAAYRDNDPGYSMQFVRNTTVEMTDDLRQAISERCAAELELLGYPQ